MTPQPKPTAEEFVKEVVRECPVEHVIEGLNACLQGRDGSSGPGCACATCIKKALLSFYLQQSEELVEALEYYAQFFEGKQGYHRREDMDKAREFFIANLPQIAQDALAAHHAKHQEI